MNENQYLLYKRLIHIVLLPLSTGFLFLSLNLSRKLNKFLGSKNLLFRSSILFPCFFAFNLFHISLEVSKNYSETGRKIENLDPLFFFYAFFLLVYFWISHENTRISTYLKIQILGTKHIKLALSVVTVIASLLSVMVFSFEFSNMHETGEKVTLSALFFLAVFLGFVTWRSRVTFKHATNYINISIKARDELQKMGNLMLLISVLLIARNGTAAFFALIITDTTPYEIKLLKTILREFLTFAAEVSLIYVLGRFAEYRILTNIEGVIELEDKISEEEEDLRNVDFDRSE